MAEAQQRIFSTEIVWDNGESGTAVTEAGASLTVGPGSEWAAEHLLTLAAATCLMTTFLHLAAEEGLQVLGYVSSGRLEVPPDPEEVPRVVLAPCIVIARNDDTHAARRLCHQGRRQSPVCRTLGRRLHLAPTFTVISSEADEAH